MKKLYISIILVLALIVVMLSRSIFFGEKNFDIKNQLNFYPKKNVRFAVNELCKKFKNIQ